MSPRCWQITPGARALHLVLNVSFDQGEYLAALLR